MKTKIIAALSAALLLFAQSVSAESATERDFKQLRANRDKAAAVALEPINQRYKEELEKLFKKATQGAELNLANTLRKELEAAGGSAPGVTEPTADKAGMKQMFEGSDWDYWLSNNPKGEPAGQISFRQAGNLSATNSPKERPITHYELVAPDIVRIHERKGIPKYRALRINMAERTATYEGEISTMSSAYYSKFFIKYVGPTPKK